MTTQEKQKEADNEVAKRKKAEVAIKKDEADIQNIRSDIDKNIDQLSSLEEYKTFLFSIFEKENKQWCEDQVSKKEGQLQQIKREWIERSKIHKDSMGDEDIFIQEMGKQDGEGPKVQKNSEKIGKIDWENRFQMLLKLDLIDVPREFYQEELLFNEPERLIDVFEGLAE